MPVDSFDSLFLLRSVRAGLDWRQGASTANKSTFSIYQGENEKIQKQSFGVQNINLEGRALMVVSKTPKTTRSRNHEMKRCDSKL